MQYDILLTKQPADGYLARPVLMPEIVVSGADEEEALTCVRAAIAQVYEHSRVVRIDVPVRVETENIALSSPRNDNDKMQLMEQAASDPLFLADLNEVSTEYAYADVEWREPTA